MLKWSFVALSLGSVFVAAYFVLSTNQSIKLAVDMVTMQAGTSITNPDIKEFDGDNLSWRIQAEKAQETDKLLRLTKPNIELFTEKRELIPIHAEKGIYDKKNQHMHFEGDVQVDFQGWTLNSEKLDFFQAKDEIKTVEAFVLKKKGINITGKDMRISRKSGKITILQGVHMMMDDSK